MRIHYLQHVEFEGPAQIVTWAHLNGHTITGTALYAGEALPPIAEIDWLVVMGGPMNVDEHDRHPWLVPEKAFIREAIDAGKTVIGVCLGAQLIARALGSPVYPGPQKEIGWYPITLTPEGQKSLFFDFLPEQTTVYHWHGDTFDLPEGAVHLAWSEGCVNQAFLYDNCVLGLQFHLELTPESVRALAMNCADELVPGTYIQTIDEMLRDREEDFGRINAYMFEILDRLATRM